MVTTFLGTKRCSVPWDLMEKRGVKLQGHSWTCWVQRQGKSFQIHLLLMSTCKAFGGHKHQACCGSPALCLENALLLHAQSQQSLLEKAPCGSLSPGLTSAVWAVCAVRFSRTHCGGCTFSRQLSLIHSPMIIIVIFFATYCAERERSCGVPECCTV